MHAAAGGVGTAAVQLGKAAGARVICVVGSAAKIEVANRAGADHVIDRSSEDFVTVVNELTGGNGADVIYDPVGGDVFERSTKCIAFEGRIVVVGFASGAVGVAKANHALVKNYGILGLHWGLYATKAPQLIAEAHRELTRTGGCRPGEAHHREDGRLRPGAVGHPGGRERRIRRPARGDAASRLCLFGPKVLARAGSFVSIGHDSAPTYRLVCNGVMTITDAPRTSNLLESDFYFFQDQLSDRENDKILEIRSFFETNVRPDRERLLGARRDAVPAGSGSREARRVRARVERATTSRTAPSSAAGAASRWPASIHRSPRSAACRAASRWARSASAVRTSRRSTGCPKLASAEVMGAFGLTEPLSGLRHRTRPQHDGERTGDTWVINGAKRWIGNATFADIVIIWARDAADDKVKGFIVRTDSPGFTATKIEDKQSLRIVQNADITLTNVKVAEEDRLQRINGFRDLAVVLRLTRAGVAWQAVGNSIGAYEAAVAYSKTRMQFGKPIGSFQLVQELLANALGNITASLALCMQVSRLQDEGRQTDAQSALAKAFVTSRARETVALCREALGGNGIVLENGVAKPFADAEAIYTFEGTRQMNTLIVGKSITGLSAFV